MALLEIENLNIHIQTAQGPIHVVRDFCLRVDEGAVHGLIGESGSGKSLIAAAILGLTENNITVTANHMALDGHNLLTMNALKRRTLLGQTVSMIFQDPEKSLTPTMTVGRQLDHVIRAHEKNFGFRRKQTALSLLESVGIIDPKLILKAYPHQLSPGITQRVLIAMAIACKPKLLIADEPATTFDVTTQTQILSLLQRVYQESNMSLFVITHNFSLLSTYTESLTVLYCGDAVEVGPTKTVLQNPMHPYTKSLVDSVPNFDAAASCREKMTVLKGHTPSLFNLPVGCKLGPRCPHAAKPCVQTPPVISKGARQVRCHFPLSHNTLVPPKGTDEN